MSVLRLLKHDLADVRSAWAKHYRLVRKADPAKARLLFKRLNAAVKATDRALEENLYKVSDVDLRRAADAERFVSFFDARPS